LQKYNKAVGTLRRYLSTAMDVNLDVVLVCALVHISIEVIQNKLSNYVNALTHLECSLQLLQHSSTKSLSSTLSGLNSEGLFKTPEVDSDLARAFLRLDLQASIYQGRRIPTIVSKHTVNVVPARFYSIAQAKEVLDFLTGQLYSLIRATIEEYRYRKDENIPADTVTEVALVKNSLHTWNGKFEKYLNNPTSKFSRQEQLAINILIINHRVSITNAATCTDPGETIFDNFDPEFDEIVTLAATVLRSRNNTDSPHTLDFSLDMGIIYPLYWTAIKCREPWIRQRAMSLLRSINFQEGVWEATAQASIASVAIAREQQGIVEGERPLEVARVYSVGSNVLDPLKRVAEVNLTQRLEGLEGPWSEYVEWAAW